MQTSLAVTALLMGLVGGPHCVAMCGAACAGIGQAAGVHRLSALWLFQAGRILGYTLLGVVAAASVQGLGWLTVHSAALRPVWSFLHIAAMLLGLSLLWLGRQPIWLEHATRRVWGQIRSLVAGRARRMPLLLGLLWALLPCGLLYSALLVAAMTSHPLEGGAVMALFALGTSVSMLLGPWLWLHLKSRGGTGDWGVRLAGLALATISAIALWMGLVHNTAPWCVAP